MEENEQPESQEKLQESARVQNQTCSNTDWCSFKKKSNDTLQSEWLLYLLFNEIEDVTWFTSDLSLQDTLVSLFQSSHCLIVFEWHYVRAT